MVEHISLFASPCTDLFGFVVLIRTLRAGTGLELAPGIQSRRALFEAFEWLLAVALCTPRAHPVHPCLKLQNFAEKIDGHAMERAEFWCVS